MKDRQAEASGQLNGIPFISPCLHCVAMTAIVFLRSSFGIIYLEPKAIFGAFCLLTGYFTFMVWYEPYLWENFWFFAHYFVAACLLYLGHLAIAIFRQTDKSAEHDQFSGTSHLLRLLPATASNGKGHSPPVEQATHLWLEPTSVFVVALALKVVGEYYLSLWLFFTAACFWLKELINYWLEIRRKKREKDMLYDVEDSIHTDQSAAPPHVAATTVAADGGRKERVKRGRGNVLSPEEKLQEERFAKVLRLMPPYSLEKAEENYRSLIKTVHADLAGESTENHSETQALTEAIAYFRRNLRQNT